MRALIVLGTLALGACGPQSASAPTGSSSNALAAEAQNAIDQANRDIANAQNLVEAARRRTPETRLEPTRMSNEEGIATLINLNGHLCARVVDNRRLQVRPNTFEITCIEYRGGSGQVRYIVDLDRGEVTPA